MIQEAYVSFEVAKLLKEKGFDEWCNYGYGIAVQHNGVDIDEDEEYELESEGRGHEIEYIDGGHLYDIWCNNKKYPSLYACPTHQMAMAWLRKKHNIYITFDLLFCGDTVFHLLKLYGLNKEINSPTFRNTIYEEAVEAALKYTLESMI